MKKFDLATTNIVASGIGSIPLTESAVAQLTDSITASGGPSISAGQTVIIDVELNNRYNLDDLRYYHSSADTESLAFSARQNEDDVWSELAYLAVGTYLNVSLSGTSNRYKTIRTTHSVSVGSAQVHEIEVYSSDDEVDFGNTEQGNIDEYTVSAGTSELVVQPVYIRNEDSVSHEYHVLVDPHVSLSDAIEVSENSVGPFYELYEKGTSLPSDYTWSSGHFSGTEVSAGNVITLTSARGVGHYYSPVLDLGALSGRRLFWTSTVSGASEIDTQSYISNVSTVGVRYANVAPSDAWASGSLSIDSNWSVISGTLPFVEYANNSILSDAYRYIQVRVEFFGDDDFPALTALGVEESSVVLVPAHTNIPVYVRSTDSTTVSGSPQLVVWFFETRSLEN